MKKIISIFAILSLILICLCIIAVLRPAEEYEPTSIEVAEEQAELILQAMIKQDTKAIKSMFSKKIQDCDDLERQIEESYEFIQGEIISYDSPKGYTLESSYKDGELEYEALHGAIMNIETDQGKEYRIYHDAVYICDDKDAIGVCTIHLTDCTDEDNFKDYFIDGED